MEIIKIFVLICSANFGAVGATPLDVETYSNKCINWYVECYGDSMGYTRLDKSKVIKCLRQRAKKLQN